MNDVTPIRSDLSRFSRGTIAVYYPHEESYVATSEPNRGRDLEWSCQAVSPMDEPCDSAATFHCGICGRWFCAAHADDDSWHTCVLKPGDEGGEA
jgi:hypothetical protein